MKYIPGKMHIHLTINMYANCAQIHFRDRDRDRLISFIPVLLDVNWGLYSEVRSSLYSSLLCPNT